MADATMRPLAASFRIVRATGSREDIRTGCAEALRQGGDAPGRHKEPAERVRRWTWMKRDLRFPSDELSGFVQVRHVVPGAQCMALSGGVGWLVVGARRTPGGVFWAAGIAVAGGLGVGAG